MPRDGVHGPRETTVEGRQVASCPGTACAGRARRCSRGAPVAAYTDARRVDYIDLHGTMTAALTSRIDTEEYQARILAMEAVYWALGIHDPDL